MKTHHIKIWPSHYEKIVSGQKTFEARWNDRDYAEGDTVVLQEFDPSALCGRGSHTGRERTFKIGYVLDGGHFGIERDFCVFSLLPRLEEE